MFRYGFFWRFLLTLFVIGVIVAGGMGLYRAGWAQGYQAAALTANPNGSGGATPILPYGGYFPYRFWPGFGPFFAPFGLFFGLGFFLLVFFLFGGIFRLWGWRRWGGYYGPGGWGPGPVPPRGREPEGRREEQPEEYPPEASQESGYESNR